MKNFRFLLLLVVLSIPGSVWGDDLPKLFQKQLKKVKNKSTSSSTFFSSQKKLSQKKIKVLKINKLLESENPKDILNGLHDSQEVPWYLVRDKVLDHLFNLNEKISDFALKLAVKYKEKVASPLLRQKIVFSMEPAQRDKNIKLLANVNNSQDHSYFIRLLRYQSLSTKLTVLKILGRKKIKKATNPVIRTLNDSRDRVKIQAIETLSFIGDQRIIIPLVSQLSSKSHKVRFKAIKVLSKFNSPLAKTALLRILKTGSFDEKLSIIEALPKSFNSSLYLKNILRSGSYKERKKAINLLRGKLDAETVFILATICSNYKFYKVLAEKAEKDIYTEEKEVISKLLSSKHLSYYPTRFLLKLAINSNLDNSVQFLRDAYDAGKMTFKQLIEYSGKSKMPQAFVLQKDLFEKENLKRKKIILTNFINNQDDRLAPVFLKNLKKYNSLKSFLLNYASTTYSSYFTSIIIKKLQTSNSELENLVEILTGIDTPEIMNPLIDAGSKLDSAALIIWSNYLLEKLNPEIVQQLSNSPRQNQNLTRSIYFLMAAAKLKNIPIHDNFDENFNIKDYLDYKGWYWAASFSGHNLPDSISEKQMGKLLDLLPQSQTPKNFNKLLAINDPEITRALYRFGLPPKYLLPGLFSEDVCSRANSVIGLGNKLKSNNPIAEKLYSRETNDLVKFNLLLNVKYSWKWQQRAQELKNQNIHITPEQWQALLHKWPRTQAVKLAKQWEFKDYQHLNSKGKRDQLVRFKLKSVPSHLKCILVGTPSGEFRGINPPAEPELVLMHLQKGRLTLKPVYNQIDQEQ
ncbi:MAG: HEAT repeat domain-containing protein [Myxococcota bacterium]